MPGILSQLVKRKNNPCLNNPELQNVPVQVIIKLPNAKKTDSEKFFDNEITLEQYRERVIFSDEGVGELRKNIHELKKIFAN